MRSMFDPCVYRRVKGRGVRKEERSVVFGSFEERREQQAAAETEQG